MEAISVPIEVIESTALAALVAHGASPENARPVADQTHVGLGSHRKLRPRGKVFDMPFHQFTRPREVARHQRIDDFPVLARAPSSTSNSGIAALSRSPG